MYYIHIHFASEEGALLSESLLTDTTSFSLIGKSVVGLATMNSKSQILDLANTLYGV